MSNSEKKHLDIPKGLVSQWIFERPNIWQMRLCSASELSPIAHRRRVEFLGSGVEIEHLWMLGLLQADLIESSYAIEMEGLEFLGNYDYGEFYYADCREMDLSESGIIEVLKDSKFYKSSLPKGLKLKFHPFRYYVLYHLKRCIQSNIFSTQPLYSVKGYHDLIDRELGALQKWISSENAKNLFRHWNNTCSLAISTEPFCYIDLFRVRRIPSGIEDDVQDRLIKEHQLLVDGLFKLLGLDIIREIHNDLCFSANRLDSNSSVHQILRLTRGENRIKDIEGELGGSIYFYTMAEMIRRTAERVYGEELPEENTISFKETNKEIYGAERIIDASRRVKLEYLREFGLDYGLKLRWYVEGDTEFGALYYLWGESTAIDIVNLKGRFIEKSKIAFSESLKRDIRNGIYSFIYLDGDLTENKRVVKNAAKNDEMCGMFFISNPDFEFANFTTDDFAEIFMVYAKERGTDDEVNVEYFREKIRRCKTGKELFNAVKDEQILDGMDKGEKWGQSLVKYAIEYPEIVDSVTGLKKTRPIIEAIDSTMTALRSDYYVSYQTLQTNPETGKPQKRNTLP